VVQEILFGDYTRACGFGVDPHRGTGEETLIRGSGCEASSPEDERVSFWTSNGSGRFALFTAFYTFSNSWKWRLFSFSWNVLWLLSEVNVIITYNDNNRVYFKGILVQLKHGLILCRCYIVQMPICDNFKARIQMQHFESLPSVPQSKLAGPSRFCGAEHHFWGLSPP